MRPEVPVPKRKRRNFTREQKAQAVALVKAGESSLAQICRDLDLNESSLRNWVKQADSEAGLGPDGALTPAEKRELQQLRGEVARLRMERDFLKKATAFFAKDISDASS